MGFSPFVFSFVILMIGDLIDHIILVRPLCIFFTSICMGIDPIGNTFF